MRSRFLITTMILVMYAAPRCRGVYIRRQKSQEGVFFSTVVVFVWNGSVWVEDHSVGVGDANIITLF